MLKPLLFLRNQKGQGVMEYVILTGLIGIFCLMAVKKIGGSLQTRLEQMEGKINKHVQIRAR
jgi:Flp pilus assembly pilin Flp